MKPHPLGPLAALHEHVTELQSKTLPELVEANRKALAECTGDEECPSSLHRPGCAVAR